jgi:hypothetical protein
MPLLDSATSVKPTALGPIASGVPEKTKPSVADHVLVVPPSGKRG